jgi:hypothetical protein
MRAHRGGEALPSGTMSAARADVTRRVGTLGVLTGVLFLAGAGAAARPAAAAPALAAPSESISSYDTRVEVRADGSMRITETIAYDFGDNDKHGILREIPARFRYDDSHDRVYPIDEVSVTVDGHNVQNKRSSSNGYEIFKVGDPNHTINGTHTYVIGYTVRGGLNHFSDHEELYWNVVGNEWQVPITTATASITGPASVQREACFSGPQGSQLACEAASMDGATATFKQSQIGDGSGLTAVVAFPTGSVQNTAPVLVDRHDLTTAFKVTPATVGGAVGLGLVGVLGALVVGWFVGRDRRYVGQLPGLTPGYGESTVERRKSLFGAPPVSVEFVPPDNVKP